MNPVRISRELTAGHPSASPLLERIMFWYKSTKFEHRGQKWVVKTASEWMDEAYLTAKQYEGAIRKLKDLGLVRTIQKRSRGKLITWVTLLVDPCGEGSPVPPVEGSSIPIEGVPHEYSGKVRVVKKECIGNCSAVAKQKEPEMTYSVDDVIMGKNPKKSQSKTISVQSIAMEWASLRSSEFDIITPPATGKDKGQLKQFAEFVGGNSKALKIIQYIVPEWNTFIAIVKHNDSLVSVPKLPHIGFLFKHRGTALNEYEISLKEASGVSSEKPVVSGAKFKFSSQK